MPLLRLPTHDRLAYIDTGPAGGSQTGGTSSGAGAF